MKKLLLFSLTTIILSISSFAQEIIGRFAIQNVETGKDLRTYEAKGDNGNKIVLYNHVEWKCMTWEFIHIEGNTYQLKNRFTSKSFQPSGKIQDGINLVQQPLSNNSTQYWIFEKADQNSYYIRLKDTQLYITLSSDATNSDIILKPKQKKLLQTFKLLPQDPSI